MLSQLDGRTRISVIIGTPIAQVRSPEGITRVFQKRGINALLVPMEVAAADVAGVVAALGRIPNLDGIVVTVPHKQAALACCKATSERVRFLGAVNVMRRRADGGFAGDHLDGESLLAALRAKGIDPAGRRALLIGAGGAGSAIGLALVEAGVMQLTIADIDASRRDQLATRLAARYGAGVTAGKADAQGFDLIVNASPAGMRPGDRPPLDAARIGPDIVVADVVTPPGVSALIAAAQAAGAVTVSGQQMFDAGAGLLADHLLGFGS
jgi:shikimate dehydrogenase